MVGALVEDRGGASAGGQHVLHQVWAVDGVPDLRGHGDGLVVGHARVVAEEGIRIGECGLT